MALVLYATTGMLGLSCYFDHFLEAVEGNSLLRSHEYLCNLFRVCYVYSRLPYPIVIETFIELNSYLSWDTVTDLLVPYACGNPFLMPHQVRLPAAEISDHRSSVSQVWLIS